MPRITALPTTIAHALQNGALDAHGHAPERSLSTGPGNPCRHCLKVIPEGEEMLILAHRPFPELQPYAECGPIFLCATPCTRHESEDTPEVLATSPDYLVKAYDTRDRIIYGTGAILEPDRILPHADRLFEDAEVAYLHIRSARNNCYLARIDRNTEPAGA